MLWYDSVFSFFIIFFYFVFILHFLLFSIFTSTPGAANVFHVANIDVRTTRTLINNKSLRKLLDGKCYWRDFREIIARFVLLSFNSQNYFVFPCIRTNIVKIKIVLDERKMEVRGIAEAAGRTTFQNITWRLEKKSWPSDGWSLLPLDQNRTRMKTSKERHWTRA